MRCFPAPPTDGRFGFGTPKSLAGHISFPSSLPSSRASIAAPLLLHRLPISRCSIRRPPSVPAALAVDRMASATASKKAMLAEDVPWRASPSGRKPVPRIHLNPVLRVQHNSNTDYALAVMRHPDPIGGGFATEARLEAAGPDCLVPGLATPVKLLGLKVWPIDINLKFLEPVGRELKALGKFMDSAVNLMNASFQDR